LYSRLSDQNSVIDPRTALIKHLHFEGWFLGNWIREKNLVRVLQISQQAQSLLAGDLQSPVHSRLPLSAAQQAVEAYLQSITAGKILLLANYGARDEWGGQPAGPRKEQ
jgi:hypothetical protein